jgi:FAD/FMN-containing dehydrogenase
VSASDRNSFLSRLAEIVGARNVVVNAADMEPFLVDWRKRYRGKALAIVQPATTQEVASVVRACHAAEVSVVPQGGNTGMCGGAIPNDAIPSIVLSLSRMKRIRDVDPLNDTITVDAGCLLAQIQQVAAGVDRLFPMSLGSEGSCQIGGNVATNAGGTAVLRYGTMRDLVLGIEAVLPSGEIWNGLTRLRKDNTGYDLRHLLVGSEGTLGVITGVVLKLFPRPKSSLTSLIAVPSIEAALALLTKLRADCGERITMFEVMSLNEFDLVLAGQPDLPRPLGGDSPWYVFLELTDPLATANLNEALETSLAAAFEDGIVTDAVTATSLTQAENIWRIRHGVTEANMRAGISVSHDTAVPVSSVPDFVNRVDDEISRRFPDVSVYYVGHLGDGNIHVVAIFPRDDYADPDHFAATLAEVNAVVDEIATSLGGSISAEHGIGQSNRRRLAAFKEPLALDFMRSLKAMLDPTNIMNPGKVI